MRKVKVILTLLLLVVIFSGADASTHEVENCFQKSATYLQECGYDEVYSTSFPGSCRPNSCEMWGTTAPSVEFECIPLETLSKENLTGITPIPRSGIEDNIPSYDWGANFELMEGPNVAIVHTPLVCGVGKIWQGENPNKGTVAKQ